MGTRAIQFAADRLSAKGYWPTYTFFPRGLDGAGPGFSDRTLASDNDAIRRAETVFDEEAAVQAVEVWRDEQLAFTVHRLA